MTTSDPNDFVAHLQQEAGDYLRSVIYFDGQDHEVAYARENLRDEYTDRDYERIVESPLAESSARNQAEDLYVHGHLNCIVRSFEDAIELHFPKSAYSGTAIALDSRAAQDLGQLIAAILDRTAFEEPLSEADDGDTE